jgi:hypothetical protein
MSTSLYYPQALTWGLGAQDIRPLEFSISVLFEMIHFNCRSLTLSLVPKSKTKNHTLNLGLTTQKDRGGVKFFIET